MKLVIKMVHIFESEIKEFDFKDIVETSYYCYGEKLSLKILKNKNHIKIISSMALCKDNNGKINLRDSKNEHIFELPERMILVAPVIDNFTVFTFGIKEIK